MINLKSQEKKNIKETINNLLIPLNLDNIIDDSDEEPIPHSTNTAKWFIAKHSKNPLYKKMKI